MKLSFAKLNFDQSSFFKKILWCQICGRWRNMAAAGDINLDLAAILLELGFSKIQKWGMQN